MAQTVVTPDLIQTNVLGYAQITANVSTTSTSAVQVTGLSITVTVPTGGRRVKITVYSYAMFGNVSGTFWAGIWDGTVGTGTQLQQLGFTGTANPVTMIAIHTPTVGTHTYNAGYWNAGATTLTWQGQSTAPSFIVAEVI